MAERPLDEVYAAIFIDAKVVKIRASPTGPFKLQRGTLDGEKAFLGAMGRPVGRNSG